MGKILIPTSSHEDWRRLLAKPDLHWKAGYSAMTLARAWEDAAGGFPPEVKHVLATAHRQDWDDLKLLLGVPEYQVALPGGSRPSQTDLLVLARARAGLVVMAVEGKVDESLGPTMGEKRSDESQGVATRVDYLCNLLNLRQPCPDHIRYQLLHRTASAVLAAHDFAADSAVMLIHSFSPTSMWFDDFRAFTRLFGHEAVRGELVELGIFGGIRLYAGWATGDQRFRELPPS